MSKQEQDTEQGPSTSAAADGYVALSEVERLFHIIDDAAYELQAGDASKAWEYLEKAHDYGIGTCYPEGSLQAIDAFPILHFAPTRFASTEYHQFRFFEIHIDHFISGEYAVFAVNIILF